MEGHHSNNSIAWDVIVTVLTIRPQNMICISRWCPCGGAHSLQRRKDIPIPVALFNTGWHQKTSAHHLASLRVVTRLEVKEYSSFSFSTQHLKITLIKKKNTTKILRKNMRAYLSYVWPSWDDQTREKFQKKKKSLSDENQESIMYKLY